MTQIRKGSPQRHGNKSNAEGSVSALQRRRIWKCQ